MQGDKKHSFLICYFMPVSQACHGFATGPRYSGSMMNNQDWISDLAPLLAKDTFQSITAEEIYSLKLSDFLRMPDLDYKAIAKHDPYISALFN